MKTGIEDKALINMALLTMLGLLFFPRMELLAGAKIRLEDFTFIVIFVIILYRIIKGKLPIYDEFILPFLYFAYPFSISLARAISGQALGPYFLVFWGKEFQYYIFFLLFFYLGVKNNLKAALNVSLFLILLNALYGTYAILFRIKDYYGIGTPFLKISPSLSGMIYLGGAIIALFINYFGFVEKKGQRAFIYLLMLVSIICCLATGSKSSSFGVLAFFVAFYFLHDLLTLKNVSRMFWVLLKWYALIAVMAIIVFIVAFKWNYQIADYVNLGRLANPVQSVMKRYKQDIIPKFVIFDTPFDYWVGVGYLAGQEPGGKINFTSGYDSQYGRNIMVLGIIGTMIWIYMLGRFGWLLRKDRKLFVYYSALLFSYLTMGIGLESFGASKSGPIFWIIVGMLLGIARIKRTAITTNEQRPYEY